MRALLRIKWRQALCALRRGGKGKWLLFAGLGLLFILVIGFFAGRVFGYLAGLEEVAWEFKLFLAEKMLLMVFLTFFSLLILSSLIAVIEVFFLSRDLRFLFSTPLPARSIFLVKTAEAMAISSAMVVFFSLPVLYAYCRHFAPSPLQILQVAAAFGLFVVCGALLGQVIGVLVPALFPVRRIQVILSAVSVALISLAVVFLRLSSPERLINPSEIREVFRFMGSLKVGILAYFPFDWLARAMTAAARGGGRAYLGQAALLTGGCCLLMALALAIEKRLYLKLCDRLAGAGGGRYRSGWKPRRGSAVASLRQKELKTFFRTPSQWTQLLVIAALLVVFLINLKMIPIPHPSVKSLVALINIGLIVFMVTGLNSRFTLPAIPGEGPGIVHLAASPFPRQAFFRFKLLFYLLPHLALAAVLFLSAHGLLGFDRFTLLLGPVVVLPAALLLTHLAVYFGLQIGNMAPLSPQHVIVSQKGVAFMLWSMIYFVVSLLFLARPLFLRYLLPMFNRRPPRGEAAAWLAAFVLANAAAVVWLYRRGGRIWREREF